MRDEPNNAMTMPNGDVNQPYQPYPASQFASQPTRPLAASPKTPPDASWFATSFAQALARALPPISALLLLMAIWLPWVTTHVAYSEKTYDSWMSGLDGLSLLVAPALPLLLGIFALFLLSQIVPLFGLVFGLALQRRPRVSRTRSGVYGAWLLLATVMSALSFAGALTSQGFIPCIAGCMGTTRDIGSGAWLALVALVLGWAAFALLIRRRSLVLRASPATAVRYSPLHRVGAGILTLGALLWALGLYAVPWATAGCTGLHLSLNHFVRGACRGVDGYDVLTAGLRSNSALVWPLLEASLVMSLFVVVTIWLPRLARSTWVTALGWLLLVALMACVGVYGVQVTAAHPPVFAYGEELIWGPSYGVALSAVGILVCFVGAALLARDELRRSRQTWRERIQ